MGASDGPDKLVFTYDNTAFTDGVGAQLQRIYGIYAIARFVGAAYLHSPLRHIEYQGFAALQENAFDDRYHEQFNDVFHIPSDVAPTGDFYTVDVRDISMEIVEQFTGMFDRGETGGKPILLRVVLPYGISDHFPDCYEVCKPLSPFTAPPRIGRPLRVVIHVRRGDLFPFATDRLLPNAYYVNVALGIAQALDARGLGYQMELWTEVPNGEFTIQPDQKGFLPRISAPVVVTPEMCALEEFDVLPNLVRRVNERAITCIENFATADILVMSRSSFSFVGAMLNKRGVVLFYPFWHGVPSPWIAVDPDGRFDHTRFGDAIAR